MKAEVELLDCPACTHLVSSMAPACPQCGHPMNSGSRSVTTIQGTSKSIKAVKLLALVIIFGGLYKGVTEAESSYFALALSGLALYIIAVFAKWWFHD
ncbi:hypothetical protein EJD96_16065 [Herbaspirillum seropedicae]|uniref:hypothetical protein n=1 Tax=Herbaspirillum seropedicae TaxID=964 RepID=UPI001120C14F|nr:hypothetical protein [Herbaspirillum seropedicae]QDD65564.1 hypothetical protein EJD96_16065 [Herbaspirillum seropedicae]